MSSQSPDDLVVSFSTVSGSGEKGKGGASARFRWHSVWHFIMGSVCYAVAYTGYNSSGIDGRPGMMQYTLLVFIIGLPIFYTQTFLGQYCQMGMLNFRYIMPMARGLMYTFFICVILKTVRSGKALTDVLLYFLMSFQPTLPWAFCPKDYVRICNGTNITDNYPHTAYVFWRYVFANDPILDIEDIWFSAPTMFRMTSFWLQWLLTFVIAVASYEKHRKVTRVLFYFHFSILCTLLITSFVCIESNVTIFHLLFTQPEELLNVNSWLLAVRSVVADLCLADLYNMYSGAHLPPKAASGTLSTGSVFAITFANYLASCLNCICHSYVIEETKTQLSVNLPHELGFGVGNILIIIPQALSFLTVPQWWCALFFLSCICNIVSNQLLHLFSMQMTTADMYPNFSKYKTYILAGGCLFGCCTGPLLYSNAMYVAIRYAMDNVVDNLMVLYVFVWSVTVYWVYGVSKLSDDIQFTMGTQPTMFWKITWYIIPAIFILMIIGYVMVYFNMHYTYIIINICMLLIWTVPYVVFFLLELFANLKKKNLLGTFQSHKKWGPPDPDERLYRKFFNPRTETTYQAHKMICRHKCLLTSVVLKNIIQQENALRDEFLTTVLKITPSAHQSESVRDTSTASTSIFS